MGHDPGQICIDLTKEFGEPFYDRVEGASYPGSKGIVDKALPTEC